MSSGVSQLILAPDSAIYRKFADFIAGADYVFFAGLPGVGKSLLLQQMALMAGARGRRVHLLQWDVARQPFESPRYPLVDGATHPNVIKATGAWVRDAIVEWDTARSPEDILLGEFPLIGGRMMEIARPADDAAEALLRRERTQFVIPVPSRQVRALIESRREQSIAKPQHNNEAHDAPPDLLRALWRDLHKVALRLRLADEATDDAYAPAVYAAVYQHLLQHRNHQVLAIDAPLQPKASVYDEMATLPQLRASAPLAAAIMARVERAESQALARTDTRAWYLL